MVSTKSKLLMIAALCGLVACTDELEPSSPQPQVVEDDSTLPPPPSPPGGGKGTTSNLVGTGPIAYGTVLADGTKYSGTSNWTSTYNAGLQRYEISITGESYYYLNYATVVTPAGDVRFCRTSSVSGMLLVYCHDHAGALATSRIGFVTSEP